MRISAYDYIESVLIPLSTISSSLTITETKIDDYLAGNYNRADNDEKLRTEDLKLFPLIIKNQTNRDYGITYDCGLAIIQEALNENGKWKPIEYIMLMGTILYHIVELPKSHQIEIGVPRYKGNFKTQLRLKVVIKRYGVLISDPFEGSINKGQFKKIKNF